MDEPHNRWVHDHGTLHVPDVRSGGRISNVQGSTFAHQLIVPLRQHGEIIGHWPRVA